MKYQVIVSPEAESAIIAIVDYIKDEFQSPRTALKKFRRIKKEIAAFKHPPLPGHRVLDDPWYQLGLCEYVFDHYRLIYITNSSTQIVYIVTLLRTSQDRNRQLARLIPADESL